VQFAGQRGLARRRSALAIGFLIGKLADLIILSVDQTAVPAAEIEKIEVLETITEGRRRGRSDGGRGLCAESNPSRSEISGDRFAKSPGGSGNCSPIITR